MISKEDYKDVSKSWGAAGAKAVKKLTNDSAHKAIHSKLKKAGKRDYEMEHEGGFKVKAKKMC